MIYKTGNRQVDTKRTLVKLSSNYEAYHEYAQFIENYARAVLGDDLDVSKLHFYNQDPEKGNEEVTPEQAIEQLETGYPIFVKHEDSPDVLPFMKRREHIYTGEDLSQVEKHPQLDLGFDYEEFTKAPAPARPSVWQYILGFFGLGNDSYREYQTYKSRLETVRANEYNIKKSIAEKDGYEYASSIYESSDIADEVGRIAKTSVDELKTKPEIEQKIITDEEIEAEGNLNINEILESAAPKNPDKPAPAVPENIRQELDARQADIKKHEKMKSSDFMKDVIHEILLNPEASEEDLLRCIDFVRTVHKDTPAEISTKEYIDYARTIILTDTKRSEANKSMEAYKTERNNRLGDNIASAITDQLMAQQEGLNREETYKTVRFGPTLKKMMNANPLYPTKLARLAQENPEKLTARYKEEAEKDAKKAQKKQAEEVKTEAKAAEKSDVKVLG